MRSSRKRIPAQIQATQPAVARYSIKEPRLHNSAKGDATKKRRVAHAAARPATCRASPNTSPAVAKKHSSAATRIAVSVVTPRSITIAAIAWKIGNSCG